MIGYIFMFTGKWAYNCGWFLSGGGGGGGRSRARACKQLFTVPGCRSRKQKRENKPVTMFVLKRCDWPISFAVACNSKNLVFNRLKATELFPPDYDALRFC